MKKFLSLFLVFTMSLMCFSAAFKREVFADTNVNDVVKSSSSILRGPGSITGNESIVSQTTVWRRGITMTTPAGAVVDAVAFLIAPALSVKQAIVGSVLTPLVKTGINQYVPLSQVVDIKFDAYTVRGADGRKRVQIYATYYDATNDSYLDCRLVQQYLS